MIVSPRAVMYTKVQLQTPQQNFTVNQTAACDIQNQSLGPTHVDRRLTADHIPQRSRIPQDISLFDVECLSGWVRMVSDALRE